MAELTVNDVETGVMVQDQAAALHAMGMMGYKELKSRLMSTTAFLVASGSLIAFSAGGPEAAYPFAVGGCAALGYQWLLQQSVDSIPSKVPRRTLVKVGVLPGSIVVWQSTPFVLCEILWSCKMAAAAVVACHSGQNQCAKSLCKISLQSQHSKGFLAL